MKNQGEIMLGRPRALREKEGCNRGMGLVPRVQSPEGSPSRAHTGSLASFRNQITHCTRPHLPGVAHRDHWQPFACLASPAALADSRTPCALHQCAASTHSHTSREQLWGSLPRPSPPSTCQPRDMGLLTFSKKL